jgi:small ligand-binding sensory domain FIST
MEFVSAVTRERDIQSALADIVSQLEYQRLSDEDIDLLLVFFSPHFRSEATTISAMLRGALDPATLLGLTAESVLGGEQEVERRPAISAIAATLPNVTVTPFQLTGVDWRGFAASPAEMLPRYVTLPQDSKLTLLLADPFSTPVDALLQAFNTAHEGLPVVGGMASGGQSPGENALLFNDQLMHAGAIGLTLSGPVEIDVIVSQGCRPVGQPMMVTEATRNLIASLDGHEPVPMIQRMFSGLAPSDRALLRKGLFIGRAVDSARQNYGRGDYLIRSVMGMERDTGALAVGDEIPPGEVVQFHVRDATTAAEDLEMLLAPQAFYGDAAGALLFTCNGRGTRLYDHPHGDITIIQNALDDVPVAGFFAAGEIGPIGGQNFLHGHTASLVIFREGATSE